MPKPSNIFIVRHGQSEGNVNKDLYREKPDYAMFLTDKGKQQAWVAGLQIKSKIGAERIGLYHSSFFRARQTMEGSCANLDDKQIAYIKEDPRLREQEWHSGLSKGWNYQAERERAEYGQFYYRFKGGESCADVYDRVSDFLHSMFRDFEKPNCPPNVAIFAHGITNRVFLMRFLHLTVEQFEEIKNPANGTVWQLSLQQDNKYKLVTPYEIYNKELKWKYPK